jgi:phosphatidylserine decarboxylase
MIPSIHREGLPIVAIFVVVTVLAWALWAPLGAVCVVLTLWCLWFFRDPDRIPPAGSGLILAPADGRLLPIVKAPPPEELSMGDKPLTRISIFMNVFNVHVNRIPADGKITAVHYRPGRFFNASFDKASVYNERPSARMTTDTGCDIAFVQIAGLIARRIRSQLAVEEKVRAGVRYGLIRFGSRVDIYLPDDIEPLVREGETMVAGVTIIAAPGLNKSQAHEDSAQAGGTQ